MGDEDRWTENTYKTLLVVDGDTPLIVACLSAGLLDAGQSTFRINVDGAPYGNDC